MPVIDLNSLADNCHPAIHLDLQGVVAYVHRQSHFFSGDGASADAHLSAVCPTLPRQSQNQILFLRRSISVYGVRTTYLPRKLA